MKLKTRICPICNTRKIKSVAFCNECWRNADSLPKRFLPKNYRANLARVEMYRRQVRDIGRLLFLER